MSPAMATGLAALTDREQELLAAYAEHGHLKGVAFSLGITYNTGRAHAKRILRKLDCESIGQAALMYDRWQRGT